jgi:hypothetical protein
MPLLHILNYINTYAAAYKVDASEVGTVGTLYSAGNQASIMMAFNDGIWAKYNLGVYSGLKDADGKPYTRNVFNRPTPADLHLLLKAIDAPPIPALAGAMPALGVESLQKMGTKFILCNNALGLWCLELEARGHGKAADIEKELRANTLPGVTVVRRWWWRSRRHRRRASATTASSRVRWAAGRLDPFAERSRGAGAV